jgi:hypothetical protein
LRRCTPENFVQNPHDGDGLDDTLRFVGAAIYNEEAPKWQGLEIGKTFPFGKM